MALRYKLGIDSGGTFTDFVLLNEESRELQVLKISSMPSNPAEAIATGLARMLELGGCPTGAVRFLSHGTTVATNALLELRGGKTAVIVTKGFKSVFEIGTMARPISKIFDIYYSRPKPLVPARFFREIEERVDSEGAVVQELDEGHARSVIRDLLKKGIDSIAVCLLFSFINPRHEIRLREIIHQEDPNVMVSLSCEVLAKNREYVRMSATVTNAFLSSSLEVYLEKLQQKLLTFSVDSKLFIMQSNGGIVAIDSAKKYPVGTLLSGPVAGVMAGNHIAKLCGFKNVITLDVGGTSTDVALIVDNQPMFTSEGEIAGRPIGLPIVNMQTLGSGGGSIASVDEGGRLHVGPQSAGANPGPACYGLGGTEPTLTDAYVLLGFINCDYFAGGKIRIDKRLSEEAVKRMGDKIGMDTIEMAQGIIMITNANIEAGIRLVSIEKGHDVRDFVLVAFGGAGPLGAGFVASHLKISQVLVPYQSGTSSALGLLISDPKHTLLLSKIKSFDKVSPEEMVSIFNELEVKGKGQMVSEGFERDEILVHRYLGLRYIGQGYEISVPVGESITNKEDKHHIRALFDDMHESIYGNCAPDQPLEVCYYHLDTVVPVELLELAKAESSEQNAGECVKAHREVYFPEEAHIADTPIYDRYQLGPDMMIAGPAIVEDEFSTTVVYPGQSARIDRYKNILINVKGGN